MTGSHLGQVISVRDLPDSRKELEVTASDYRQTTVTLMPGLLGTELGAELLQRMADVRTNAYATTRPKPRRKPEA